MFSRRLTTSIAVAAAAVAVAGGAYGIVNATSDSTPAAAGGAITAKVGSNARSGPASVGASGTVGSVSTSSFTMSTSAGKR